MREFVIHACEYLSRDIRAFYSVPYCGYQRPGNPDYLNVLKNTFNEERPRPRLYDAVKELQSMLLLDLPRILEVLAPRPITTCVVPRSRADFKPNQLLFRDTVKDVAASLRGFVNGADYMIRHTNTSTTHLGKAKAEGRLPDVSDGPWPYPGITKATCDLSPYIRGKDILLVDDVYTPGVCVDEDAIQALLDSGACSVAFYAVALTNRRQG